jgi:NAD(P)H-flavin reductase
MGPMPAATVRPKVAARDTARPAAYRVERRSYETPDVITLALEPVATPLHVFRPGQFAVLSRPEVGATPAYVSGRFGTGGVLCTAALGGPAAPLLSAVRAGQVLGVLGPLGTAWPLPVGGVADLLLMGGGIGMAALRPVVRHAVAHRGWYRRVVVVCGARTPAGLVHAAEYARWQARGVRVHVIVESPREHWAGRIGPMSDLVEKIAITPDRTVALLCGSEAMMSSAATELIYRGVAPQRIYVGLQRRLNCGRMRCGQCALGPVMACRDGAVVAYPTVAEPLAVAVLRTGPPAVVAVGGSGVSP